MGTASGTAAVPLPNNFEARAQPTKRNGRIVGAYPGQFGNPSRKDQPDPRAEAPVPYDQPPPPFFALETLPPAMLRNRELLGAWATSRRMEQWMRVLCARHGIPMDTAGLSVELMMLLVECELVARVTRPGDYVREYDADDAAEEYPALESDALAQGLRIVAPPVPRDRAHATLPGCQWHLVAKATPCIDLRAFGQRFCPHHANQFLRMIRANSTGG